LLRHKEKRQPVIILRTKITPQKKMLPSCGMGILPVLLLLAGFSACTTRNFGIFFICKSLENYHTAI
ncbi:MAG: hypothetical protein ACKO86_20055, partial [Dolichospermum sp.]